MNKTVLTASTLRSYKPRLFDTASPFGLLEAVKEKYEFKSAPTLEYVAANAQGPFNFLYGKFPHEGRTIIIEQFLVTYVGVAATTIGATTKTNTNDSDAFLNDLETLAKMEKVDTSTVAPDYHHSILEVTFSRSVSGYFGQLQGTIEKLTQRVRAAGFDVSNFEVSGFSLQTDISQQRRHIIGAFSIERRAGVPFSENKYFSQAPLRTAEHEELLRELESLE
jgi:hypothetical protein